MARTIPTSVIEAVNAQTTDKAFLFLLEVTHSTFDTIRVVNNTEIITSGGNAYLPFPFSVILPPDSDEFQPILRINIVNVSRLLVTELRSIAGSREKIKCTIKVIDGSAPDVSLATWSEFEVANVSDNADTMTFDLVIENFLSEPFPGDSFAPSTFRGVF